MSDDIARLPEWEATVTLHLKAPTQAAATALVREWLTLIRFPWMLDWQFTEVQPVTTPAADGGIVLGTHESPGRG
jgi:hypothetical protein